ncbi:OLC1v1030431C1 [Oldenlandia corymbosa var. corymbosa]|uniref:OLC1v1030431C1 n=1 Tax=Oldenlandia corymbosa var. corymbosa TaxID=529605 RepID=A0AAV1CG20_OLDCO|nr:OLC1v1030431C1 [Oldenlandia corymbosa var. corymbosa]
MEIFMTSFVLSSIFAVALTAILLWKGSKSGQRKLLPSPRKLPIIGHLHHLSGAPPHHALRTLSQKYGPLIHLWLGEIPAIVVSSPRLAREVTRTQDIALANRPEFLVGKILCYNSTDIACAPYGEYWRQIRKICTLELLTAKNVRAYGSIRHEEALNLISSIKALVGHSAAIDLTEKLAEYTSSTVVRTAFGKVSKDDHNAFLELVREATPLSSAFEISDLFPSLKILHPFLSIRSKLMKIHYRLDRLLDNIIDQYEKLGQTKTSNEDLLDVLIRVKHNNDLQVPITRDNIKAIMHDIFTAGTETTSSTLDWAMVELIRHPEVMAKLQNEIRTVFGEKETIEEADIQEIGYLKSVVKETLRLHPPVPLLVPRESREQTEIDGNIIPAKTRVLVNAWAIGRDPQYWDDQESFKPERFEGSDKDFAGNHFEYIPFGAGRRMCPGMSFGLASLYLPLALFLHHFNWKLPNGVNPEDLDMGENVSIATSRTNHLLLIPSLHQPFQTSGR